jgi:hypothetical protein
MLLASLGEDTSEDVTAEPPSSDEEPAPISQDVPPLEDES